MNEIIEIPCLEVSQNIGKFYVGVIDYKDLLEICFVDVRRLADRSDELEEYTGIQRMLDPNRVSKIAKYLESPDATFPTSIILSLNSSDTTYDDKAKVLSIKRGENVAKVIDGQHRIRGLEKYKGLGKFELNVTFFLDVELEEQALIFATINLSQTKVNSSLVADLFEFTKVRSPQKTCHHICKALNEKKGSPFKDKIKILGVADDKEKETITQANFVEQLIVYITDDRVKDRNLYKKGSAPRKAPLDVLKKFIFRNLFIEEKDADIATILSNFFKAVELKWPEQWLTINKKVILNRSTGFVALMRFLKPTYLHIVKNEIGRVPSLQQFVDIFDAMNIKGADLTSDNFEPGGTGRSKLYRLFLEKSNINEA